MDWACKRPLNKKTSTQLSGQPYLSKKPLHLMSQLHRANIKRTECQILVCKPKPLLQHSYSYKRSWSEPHSLPAPLPESWVLLAGLCECCGTNPCGFLIMSMCRAAQGRAVHAERAHRRASQCHVCACVPTTEEDTGSLPALLIYLMFSCFCFSIQDKSFNTTALAE